MHKFPLYIYIYIYIYIYLAFSQFFYENTLTLLMVQKGIRDGICHATYWYAKASNKYMKDYDKNKELSYHKYWDLNSLCCWVMPQKLSQKLGWTNIWI